MPMPRTVPVAIRELCLSFPEAVEVSRHGVPNFKVNDKTFAMFCINHHGDGRVALWLHSPEGAQQLYTQLDPDSYFVPPYVGPSGWLGMNVIAGLDWKEINARVQEAWENRAPPALHKKLCETPAVAPPEVDMKPEDIDLMLFAELSSISEGEIVEEY